MRVLAALFVLLTGCASPSASDRSAAAVRYETPAQPGAPRVRSALELGRPGSTPIPRDTRQLITVVTGGWDATAGRLQRWERQKAGWAAVGEPVPVVVGRSGLGWGLGLHTDSTSVRPGEPSKAEGDGRAPAGAFRLDRAFGYAPSEPTGLDYLQATPTTVCIDDQASAEYNTVYDADRDPGELGVSLERMRRPDTLYRLGVIVDHNGGARGGAPAAGAGSCIFLHVWRGPGSTTAGCTAMPDAALAEALAWLDAEAAPVLIQLPAEVYARLEGSWSLPPR